MGVRFRVLGSVELIADGAPLSGAAPRHRAVLAYLLLNAGQVLSAERIIEAIWGVEPPDTARSQIHAAVTAIRRVLRTAGADQLLQTKPAGYVVRPEPGGLDLAEFIELVARGQSLAATDSAAAVKTLRAALGLWRGAALADVNADYVAGARARLEEKRLSTLERLLELELSLGKHEELLDELATCAEANPLRERLHGHRVLALHRAGRQADALIAARAFRNLLAQTQGLDPSRTFLALEQAVLQDDPGLMLPRRPGPSADAQVADRQIGHVDHAADGQAGHVNRPGDADPATWQERTSDSSANPPDPQQHRAAPAQPVAAPNFLPYDIPDFAGRAAELGSLSGQRADGSPASSIVVLDGMPGIGKTTLAIHLAHRVADRFPDGRLFVDLQGHTRGREPVEPGAALEILLRQLGISTKNLPGSTADRAALWRSELAHRAVVVVLDNAADAEQIRPLLPGSPTSLLLVTSRRRLIDLDGVAAVSLDLLPAGDAVELFGRIVGARAEAEPVAVLDVLQLCGFLPLAVRIAAARLHHRPRWTVEYLADRLRDERRRLAELATADRGVAAAFTLSYEQLTPEQQRMFRLLGLHPGRDVDRSAAAALAGVSVYDAEDQLEDLLDAHMLTQHEPGRYVFHDLLREYAHSTALSGHTEEERRTATLGLFDHYLHHARAAVDQLFPYSIEQRPELPAATVAVGSFGTDADALAWLDVELENLTSAGVDASRCEWPFRVCLLASTLRPYLDGHALHSAATMHGAALRTARQLGDRVEEGRALTDLGWTAWRRGDYAAAENLSRQAMDLCRTTGAVAEEARALNTLGNVAARRRDFDAARRFFELALDRTAVEGSIGNRVGAAHVLGNLGVVLDRCGRPEQAHDHLQRARELHCELGNRRGEALLLNNIGLVYRREGSYARALEHHRAAAEIYESLCNRSDKASACNGIGETYRAAGDPARALIEHEAALRLAEDTGNRPEQVRAYEGLARAHHDLGDVEQARRYATPALDGYRTLGVPECEDIREFLDGLAPRSDAATAGLPLRAVASITPEWGRR